MYISSFALTLSVACYEQDRDEMRRRLIDWMRVKDESREGMSGFRNLLRTFFDSMDKNKDGGLDSKEFTDLIKTNNSISEVGLDRCVHSNNLSGQPYRYLPRRQNITAGSFLRSKAWLASLSCFTHSEVQVQRSNCT